jgi:hypothetical protein
MLVIALFWRTPTASEAGPVFPNETPVNGLNVQQSPRVASVSQNAFAKSGLVRRKPIRFFNTLAICGTICSGHSRASTPATTDARTGAAGMDGSVLLEIGRREPRSGAQWFSAVETKFLLFATGQRRDTVPFCPPALVLSAGRLSVAGHRRTPSQVHRMGLSGTTIYFPAADEGWKDRNSRAISTAQRRASEAAPSTVEGTAMVHKAVEEERTRPLKAARVPQLPWVNAARRGYM